MNQRIFGIVAVLGLLLPLTCGATAGPPLLTDDPETPGSNRWEINLAVTSEITSDEAHLEAPIADINYGLGEYVQLKYEVPWAIVKSQDQPAQSGLDQSLAGVKWRFLDRAEHGFSMSAYPQIGFVAPVSDQLKNVALTDNGGTEFLLPVEIQEYSGAFQFNEELGYTFYTRDQNKFLLALAMSYSIRDGFMILTEIHGNFASDLADREMVFNIGTEIDLSETFGLLASVGRSIHDFGDGPPKTLSYLGIQFHH